MILKSRQITRSRGRPSGSARAVEFDRNRRLLTKDGRPLRRLTRQEALTLDFLIRRTPGVVTNEELQNLLWPDTEVSDPQQRIRDIVADLRTVLGDSASAPCFIETTPGVGYSFVGVVEVPEDDPSPVEPAPKLDKAPPAQARPSRRPILVAALGIGGLAAVAVLLNGRIRGPGPAPAAGGPRSAPHPKAGRPRGYSSRIRRTVLLYRHMARSCSRLAAAARFRSSTQAHTRCARSVCRATRSQLPFRREGSCMWAL